MIAPSVAAAARKLFLTILVAYLAVAYPASAEKFECRFVQQCEFGSRCKLFDGISTIDTAGAAFFSYDESRGYTIMRIGQAVTQLVSIGPNWQSEATDHIFVGGRLVGKIVSYHGVCKLLP